MNNLHKANLYYELIIRRKTTVISNRDHVLRVVYGNRYRENGGIVRVEVITKYHDNFENYKSTYAMCICDVLQRGYIPKKYDYQLYYLADSNESKKITTLSGVHAKRLFKVVF